MNQCALVLFQKTFILSGHLQSCGLFIEQIKCEFIVTTKSMKYVLYDSHFPRKHSSMLSILIKKTSVPRPMFYCKRVYMWNTSLMARCISLNCGAFVQAISYTFNYRLKYVLCFVTCSCWLGSYSQTCLYGQIASILICFASLNNHILNSHVLISLFIKLIPIQTRFIVRCTKNILQSYTNIEDAILQKHVKNMTRQAPRVGNIASIW